VIKIVIVEDENLIRKGLVHSIYWLSMDCVIAAEASDGVEGLKAIEEVKPDLVITDIKMPLMDGIEMLQKATDLWDFEKVILTSYGEFEYAKKAIDLDVFDYLLKPYDEEQLKNLIERVKVKIKEKHIFKQLLTSVKDSSDFNIIQPEGYIKAEKDTSKPVKAAIQYIIDNYADKIKIEDVANQLAVSPSYLSRKFKEETNHTFHDFLNKYRVQKSVELLKQGDYKVYEISYMVGFNDYKHYSTVFKKYTKLSPMEFAGKR